MEFTLSPLRHLPHVVVNYNLIYSDEVMSECGDDLQ